MKTLEDILVERDELDRIYLGELKLQLWRAVHKTFRSSNKLYPDFDPRSVRGELRAPDVEVKTIDGVENVVARLGQGTSLFDRPGTFGHKSWTYFEIPEGTIVPAGLIIVRDTFNKKYKATHYTISPNYTMPKDVFVSLLDQLAQNAKRRKEQKSKGHG